MSTAGLTTRALSNRLTAVGGGRRRRRLQQDLGPSSEEASLVASAAARSAAPLSAVAGPAASVPGRRRTELPSDVVFTEVSLSTPVRVSWEAGVTVVAVAHFAGGDATRAREAAHFLATLIMTLPLANVQIVASEDDAALLGDVVAHFRMRARQRGGDVGLVRLRGGESYVSAVRTLLSAAPAGAVVVTDVAGVIWQSDVSRPALRELAGDGAVAFASPPCRGGGAGCCFGSGQTTCTLVGAAAAVAAALSGSVASNPAASAALAAFFGAGEGCVVNAYAEAAPSAAAAPYLAVHGAARCAALRRRLSTFDWVAAPVGGAAGDKGCEAGGAAWCRAPLSRLKNLQRTIALAKASGVEHLGGLEAADRIRAAVPQRFPRYAPPPRASARPDCLLVGAADYQNPGFYARFLRSLREAGADCDVTIFTNGASHAGVDRIFRKYRARWLEFFPANATKNQGVWGGENTRAVRAKAFATLPGNGRAASTYRFLFFYYYFLQAPHSRVGWTDVRDVVFQADPFALRPALAVFTETARFTLEHKKRVYLDWSKSAWGYDCDAAFGAYAYLPPVNLGAVFGDRGAVLKALAELVKDLRKCGGWDQFVFSKLAYTQLDAQAYTTDDGPVANLCSNVDVRLGAMREVVNERREVYSVVHQWDRFDALVETRRTSGAARVSMVVDWSVTAVCANTRPLSE
ncbi:hypothetical protein M885DRAFT_298343 [Pelagophyceae sp. CCMP2097]|nr:hypothetical protein M885DRAFT_298343 [Pelagophyceae sp. CCMP2097]